MLNVSRPSLGEEEIRNVKQVLDSGWLGHGESVIEFEKAVCTLLGARHVIAVSTGTAALHLALDALEIGDGDEVIVPSLTFCSSVQAITALNAIPVFCEVETHTLNIDVRDAMQRITSKTRAIMPVHYCGNACDMDALLDLGCKNRLTILEDAAHAFGSSFRGRLLGSFGHVTCFSFDPIKNITCGEGGAVALSDDDLANSIRCKRMLGMDRDGWQRTTGNLNHSYEVNTQGYRYHMSNINAAIGLAQLSKLGKFRERRREIVRRYNERFEQVRGLQVLEWNLAESCPFAYVLRVRDGRRDGLRAFLAGRGIGSGIHYTPNHLQPYFAAYTVSLPATECLYAQIVTLPLHCDMTDDDVNRVVEAVSDFFLKSY